MEAPKEACFIPYVDFVAYNVNPNTLEVSFTAITSYNGVITSHHWDFGDGTSYNGEIPPPHKYPPQSSSTSTDAYTIKYTVTNDCGEAYWTHDVKIGKCLPNVNVSYILLNDSTVQFKNATTSPTPVTYEWNFGDGTTSTSGETTITKTYAFNGKYTVTLKATNACGDNFFIVTVPVCSKPVPSQKIALSGCSTVLVDASATKNGELYQWDFGDGTILPASPTESSTISYTYASNGKYNVKLKVINKNACDSATITTPVTIESTGIVPNDNWNYSSDDLEFNFSPAAVAGATSYLWDFGDGTTSTQQNPGKKVYANPGVYHLTLTASNSCGEYKFNTIINAPSYKNIKGAPNTGFRDIVVFSAQQIYYLGSNGKLYRTDTAGNWSDAIDLPSSLHFDNNTKLYKDINNELWIYGRGEAARFNAANLSWSSFFAVTDYKHNETIDGIAVDNTGALWTVAGKEVRRNNIRIESRGNKQFSSIAFASATGRVWITASNQNDLFYVNTNSAEIQTLNGAAIRNGADQIKIHPNGDIYFATNTGIVRVSSSGSFISSYTAMNTNGLLSGAPVKFDFDNKGNIWAVYAGRLLKIPIDGGASKNYSFTPDLLNVSSVGVLNLTDADTDILLAKTTANGVIQIK